MNRGAISFRLSAVSFQRLGHGSEAQRVDRSAEKVGGYCCASTDNIAAAGICQVRDELRYRAQTGWVVDV